MPSYSHVMEKGHYGNADHGAADVTSDSAGFVLDFPGMLDASDSVLHQQLYEYLHGPAVQQPDHHHHHHFLSSALDQGPGFSELYPGATSFPALSTFQASLPGEPLRGPPNFVDTSSAHGTFSEYQRKEHSMKAQAGMGMPMLPTGMGCCSALPAQMYSTDHVFHPGPNFVYNAPEFSSYEASCSPNGHLKRPGGEPDIPRARKAPNTEQEFLPSPRPPEQAEHIIRERQRRDDMTSKFLMLESLLPPGPKRDRSTVVEDSIQYVKSLHHRVKELHGKRSEMKSSMVSSPTADKLKKSLVLPDADQKAPAPPKEVVKNPAISQSESDHALATSRSSVQKIEVHLDLPHQIVVEMTCLPHRHIQSQIMAALERLRMDVARCSISNLYNRLICVVVVKPREVTDPLVTGDDVIGALKRTIVPD